MSDPFTKTSAPVTTPYGFKWGAVNVQRAASIDGRIVLTISTSAGKSIDVYVSAEGRSLRVFSPKGGELR